MTQFLDRERAAWLAEQVATGRFQSIEEALALAVDGLRGTLPVIALSDEERRAVCAALAEAEAGDYASDAEVETVLAKFGP